MAPFPTLVLGDLDLTDWSGIQYDIAVIAEGTSRGGPVPIEVAVKSWLQDGSVVVTQGYDNREVSLRVRMRGPDQMALAECEAALFAELGKSNLLTWTPSDGYGPASVFVVVTSSMVEAPGPSGDLEEQGSYPSRSYNLRLVCEAFVRSADHVGSIALLTAGSTTTTLDAMGATTGWTGFVDGGSTTVSNASGANSVAASLAGKHTLAMQKTFAATTTSTKLLMVDWKTAQMGGTLSAIGDGLTLPLMAETASPTSGYVRSYFQVEAASLAVTRFEWVGESLTLYIDNVAVTDVHPIVGTGRQQTRSLKVLGSARSQGSLAVESETAALGDALVYVYPATDETSGYSPSLRQFRTAGNTETPDAAMVSGFSEPVNNPDPDGITFTVPIGLFPKGAYLLLARVASGFSSQAGEFTCTTQTKIGSNDVGVQTQVSTTYALTTTYQTITVGRLQLPTIDLDPQTPASMQLILSLSGLWVDDVLLDEAWLFNTTIGRLVRVDCGTGAGAVGGSARRLFIEPATVSTPRPTVRIGHSADRSDSFYPQTLTAWQFPEFYKQVNVMAVTPNATDAVISLHYPPTWHTHAAL